MTIQERIVRRKIGAFELLLGDIVVEIIFGSILRLLIVIGLCAGFYWAKREFKGEFSLLDVSGLFKKKPETSGTSTT